MEIGQGPEVVEKSVYTKWVESQGVPVFRGFYVEDIRTAKLEPWERMGGLGAFINLFGDYATNDAYLCEIPAGKTLNRKNISLKKSFSSSAARVRPCSATAAAESTLSSGSRALFSLRR